ncbi:MAG: hypothetical protein AAF416_19230 [Pseudomonadota bacterium]
MTAPSVFEALSLVIATSAAAVAAYQIYLSRAQHTAEYEWRRRERAISYSVYKNAEYRVARDRVHEALGSFAGLDAPLKIQHVYQKCEIHPKLRADLFVIISHWGRLSTEIELNLIDEDAAFKYHSSTMPNVYFGLKEFIDSRIEKNPLSYPDLVKVGDRWLKRRGEVRPDLREGLG